MSYKFSFADNEVYSATDVNNITKRLVTSGIADGFSDGVAYNASKFNETGKLLYTSGVVSEDCNTLKVTKASDTEILINPGTAFFDDGAVIEIEEGGECLTFVFGSKNYVYLKNMLLDENRCYPCVSVNEPTGDYVLLAEIDENGKITDKRTYAMGKLPGYQSVGKDVLFFNETIEVILERSSYGSAQAEFNIGNNAYQYILFTNLDVENQKMPNISLYKISDGSVTSFYTFGNPREKGLRTDGKIVVYENFYYPHESYIITASFKDGILKIDAEVSCSWLNEIGKAGNKVNVELNAIFI